MHAKSIQALFVVLFLLLIYGYYYLDFGGGEIDRVFITITTFVFSMFAGFFITRQSNRYTKIREIISSFDGKLSGCYRAAVNISPKVHEDIGSILKAHYEKVVETKRWDYHLANRSNTISSIHAL